MQLLTVQPLGAAQQFSDETMPLHLLDSGVCFNSPNLTMSFVILYEMCPSRQNKQGNNSARCGYQVEYKTRGKIGVIVYLVNRESSRMSASQTRLHIRQLYVSVKNALQGSVNSELLYSVTSL